MYIQWTKQHNILQHVTHIIELVPLYIHVVHAAIPMVRSCAPPLLEIPCGVETDQLLRCFGCVNIGKPTPAIALVGLAAPLVVKKSYLIEDVSPSISSLHAFSSDSVLTYFIKLVHQ